MQLIETPDNPIPAGTSLSALMTPDGMRLRSAAWPGHRRTDGRTAGTVCLLQGRAEFIEKYFETIGELTARGYAVMTFDWRSQGGSQRTLADPRKSYVRRFADYETDLHTFMAERVLATCVRPLIGLAHSMGAAILLAHLAKVGRQFDRVVLTSPMIGLPGLASSRLAEWVTGALHGIGLGSAFIPGGGSTIMDARPFTGNVRTSDPVRYRRNAGIVAADPSLGLGSPTIGWTHAVLAFMRYLRGLPSGSLACDRAAVVASAHDDIVSFAATRDFVARHANATLHPIGGGARHELLMEKDRTRQEFWSVFDATVR